MKVNGWPQIFVVATRHIGTGERLLIDYGDAFWEYHDKLLAFGHPIPNPGPLSSKTLMSLVPYRAVAHNRPHRFKPLSR